MNILRVAFGEISNIAKNKFIRISIIAIIILPLLYSFLFLDAFWDPYNKLDRIHMAVVNLDKGGISDSKQVNYGNDIVDKLKENKTVGWVFVDKDKAQKNLIKGKYYGEFVIPENFTKTVLKVKDVNPEQLTIKFEDNEKANFIMSQLNKNIKLELKQEITKNIMDKGVGEVFDKLDVAKPGIKQVVDASNMLQAGVNSLSNGNTSDMKAGVNKLTKSAADIASGLNTVSVALNNKPILSKTKTKVNKNNDLFKMIEPGNVKKLKSIMDDAAKLQKVDTSMLNIVPKLMTPENIKLLNKMGYDVKTADLAKIMNDSTVKSLPTVITPANMKNVATLLNDANKLSQVNMMKLIPMAALLNNSNQLSDLMTQAQMLANMDMSVLKPFNSLLGQSQKLSGLMLQASLLSQMDLSKLDSIKALLSEENVKELSSLLNNASSLGNIDTKTMSTFLAQQIASIDKFNTDTEKLRNPDALNGMLAMVDAQYPANGAPAQQKANAQFKAMINGYYNAVTQTNESMQATKSSLASMGTTLSSLGTLQQQFIKDSKLITGATTALKPENVSQITSMINQLQAAQNSMKTPEATAAMKTIQTALTPTNIKTLTEMLDSLQKAQNSMKSPQAVAAIQSVQTALAPGNLDYIKGVLSQLMAMKTDLDKNKDNLVMAEGLLKKFNDPKTTATLNKIKVLSSDIDSAKPLINTLMSQMTAKNMDKLKDAPKLVNQLTSMQKELKDNNEVLEMSKKALKDDNITLANNLINSIPDLTNDVNAIAKGTQSLYDQINKAENNKESIKKFVSEPLVLSNKYNFPINNYGTGFAPYFIPLSLWIGALIMFFVVDDKVSGNIKAGTVSQVLGKYLSFVAIGVVQAVAVSLGVLALGLKPSNLALYFLFNIFLSLTFISIIQCLVFLMGLVGRMLSLILLILQLTTCAGTFPLELVPPFFKALNPFLPFTYGVSAIREIIAGIDYSVLSKDCSVLGGMLVVFLIISVLLKGHADKVQEMIREKKESMA